VSTRRLALLIRADDVVDDKEELEDEEHDEDGESDKGVPSSLPESVELPLAHELPRDPCSNSSSSSSSSSLCGDLERLERREVAIAIDDKDGIDEYSTGECCSLRRSNGGSEAKSAGVIMPTEWRLVSAAAAAAEEEEEGCADA